MQHSPLFLIPSYGQSKLITKAIAQDKNETTILWPPFNLDETQLHTLRGRLDENFRVVSDKNNIQVSALDTYFGLDGIYGFNTGKFMVDGWSVFIDHLIRQHYLPGYSLFAYPYDWRQSLGDWQILQTLLNRLERAFYLSGKKKLHVITFGTGGRLFDNLLKVASSDVYKYVERWICIQCPFQGSGEYLRSLLFGTNCGIPSFSFTPMERAYEMAVCTLYSQLILYLSLSSLLC